MRAAETKEKESKPKAEKKPFSPPALDGKRHQMMCCPWWPWATLKQCSLAQGSQSTAPAALGSRLIAGAFPHDLKISAGSAPLSPLLRLLSLNAMQALRSDPHLLQAPCPPPSLADPQAAFCAKHR